MEKRVRKPATKWHAVVVVVQETSCAAATLCRTVRHLAKDAPRLPLSACDRAHNCKCTYRHFDDRRTGKRRSADAASGGGGAPKPKTERRGARGRRATDR